jgi:hypothetical protein
MPKKQCEQCGEEYLPRQHNQRFCGRTCSDAHYRDECRRGIELLRSQTYSGRVLAEAADAPGRFAAVGAVAFGGPLPVADCSRDPVPREPPLGIDVEATPDLGFSEGRR